MISAGRFAAWGALLALLAGCNLLPQATDTPAIKSAGEEMHTIREACQQRLRSGELKSLTEYEQCADPAIIAAYEKADYPYMDLIRFALAARLAGAEKVDAGQISEKEYDEQREELRGRLADEIDRRNAERRSQTAPPASSSASPPASPPPPPPPNDQQLDPATAAQLTAGLSAFSDVHP